MWIVKLALRRPYTFIVMAILIVMLGVASIRRTPTDIFPNIDIPVVSLVWTYTGLSTEEMERQITTFSEFSTSFAVSNIKKIESQTLNGVAVIKVSFQPDVDVASATAQVTGVAQTILRRMPPGTVPPFIVRYNAGSVPILQMSLSSDRHSEAELYDYGVYRMRQQLAVVQGTTFPLPYGGSSRQISVDLDPQKLLAYGVAAQEVSSAINAQNLILPTGSAKIGKREYTVSLNSSPDAAEALNNVPLKRVNGKTIFVRDVATVHDGFAVQTQVVRENGRRGVMLTVLKNGNSSTLDIANQVRSMLPEIQRAMPEGMKLELISDQSRFVRASIHGVLVEGLVAASLTGLLILLFLGSWRSTLIVTISIPLSILVAVAALSTLGQTLNIMTLGGLALAVGILVDDATVEIENIHRNLAMGKPLKRAILDGAQQIAVPAFVATTAISIVFLSVLFLEGAARYLFMGMAMAVGFSVMASYFLSRTVIPTLVMYLLKDEAHANLTPSPGTPGEGRGEGPSTSIRNPKSEIRNREDPHPNPLPGYRERGSQRLGFFRRFHLAFERRFESFREAYVRGLDWALHHNKVVFAVFGASLLLAALLVPHVGQDFFPAVDAGQIRMHVTAPAGTRIEETEKHFTAVAQAVRELIPEHDRGTITDVIGVPDGINLAVTDSNILSSADGEMLIGLAEHRSRATQEYVALLRRELPKRFPQLAFHFEPADIVSQILNFGVPAPIDVQVSGFQPDATYAAARAIADRLRQVPGAADVRIHQVTDAPRLHLEVDQSRVAELGLTQRDVANDVLVATANSFAVTPNYWIDPKSGLKYAVSVQTPKHLIGDVQDLQNINLLAPDGRQTLLGDATTVTRRTTPVVANHNNIQPTFNVRADVQGTDLGSVGRALRKIVDEEGAKLPPGASVTVQGQVQSMTDAFRNLGQGIVFAAALVYLLMVVNFQSWTDPFIILTALGGAAVGIVLALFATGTTFSVPSLMGAIMAVGVATANSILMVTFANDRRQENGDTAVEAALAAGRTRLRPVLMTALAMIVGMLPMSLGLSEGGEQNAPLGRAVIGGLVVATFATLFFVPVVYTVLRRRLPRPREDPELHDIPDYHGHHSSVVA
jgi:multidrug efflux pump subunit AcrB